MKTDALIDLLARDAGPAPRQPWALWLAAAALVGMVVSAMAATAVIGLIPRPMFSTPAPWMKLAYAAGLAAFAAWWVARMGRPGASAAMPARGLATVVMLMTTAGVLALLAEPFGERLLAWLGHSAPLCPWNVLVLSLPTLALVMWRLRQMAPTRLRAAGFAAGVLSGAIGAAGYALACTETSPAFVASWYTLGIAMAGGVGALIGPRVLRW
jgi:hypothetical protein